MNNVKIMGADQTGTNSDGSNWKQDFQVATAACYLSKLSFKNISAADIYLWIFDTATGSTTSQTPVHVRYIPADLPDTWDLGVPGTLFRNGLYLIAVDADPAGVNDTPSDHTPPGDDVIIIKADWRLL